MPTFMYNTHEKIHCKHLCTNTMPEASKAPPGQTIPDYLLK